MVYVDEPKNRYGDELGQNANLKLNDLNKQNNFVNRNGDGV